MVLADGIVVRASPGVGGGKGLFATQALAAGAMVWREDPDGEPQWTSTPRSAAWVAALPPAAQRAYRHFMCGESARCPRLRLRCAERYFARAFRARAGTRPATTSTKACRSLTNCRSTSTKA
jgi:hypothetical protein